MTASGSEAADEVVRLEQELLLTASRQSEDRLNELLDPAFVEIGASGRRWGRDATIAALVGEALPLDGMMTRTDVAALAPGVLLLTYDAEIEGRRSLRCSVWLQVNGDWRLRFHQGTPVSADQRGIG